MKEYHQKKTPVLFITNYRNLLKYSSVINTEIFQTIVLDEAHMIKNAKTKLSIFMKELVGNLKIALTGTPI